MILHVFPNQKFTHDYVVKINELFPIKDHLFWIYGERHSEKIYKVEAENAIFASVYGDKKKELKELSKRIKNADKVILHSLFFDFDYLKLLCLNIPWQGRKYFWNIWGADLYNEYRKRHINIRIRFKELFRILLIRNLRAVGYIPSDYAYLKEHYSTKADFYLLSYYYRFHDVPARVERSGINIMLGNSATEECRYHEVIKKIASFHNNKIKVFCILSYPESGKDYRDNVTKYGKEMLGEKFVPIIDFMTYDEYLEFLSHMDVAVFNHDRQQGLGNIAELLYLGKKIFINPDNGCKEYFERIGAEVYSTDDLSTESIFIPIKDSLNNKRIIETFFSDYEFANRWNKVFTSDYSI